jgi:hypothetical protein
MSDFWTGYLPIGILRILIAVALGTFIGTIFECRNWLRFASFLSKPMMKFGKLSGVSGTSFMTAFFSNTAASSMLAGAYSDKKISRKEMILGGIANSYPAQISHLFRTMIIIVPLIGVTAVVYFAIQFILGFIRTSVILWLGSRSKSVDAAPMKFIDKEQISWGDSVKKAAKRTKRVLTRVILVTMPLYILVTYLAKSGFFRSWKGFLPEALAPYLTTEVLTIIASKMGGIVSASTIASELYSDTVAGMGYILLAFFIGNLMSIPIRTLRRNLPTALGIYPGRDGAVIVFILQSTRFLFAMIGVAVIVSLLGV